MAKRVLQMRNQGINIDSENYEMGKLFVIRVEMGKSVCLGLMVCYFSLIYKEWIIEEMVSEV